jgi:hypothetical protein
MDKVTDISEAMNSNIVNNVKQISDIPNYDATKYYTLDGREIEGNPQKGIYIHQGKKIVIK